MRAIRIASAALLSISALALSAPAAVARDHGHNMTPFGFSVLPSTVAAGSEVKLHVNRDGDCKGPARVTSVVFDTVVIPAGRSWATAVVDRDYVLAAAGLLAPEHPSVAVSLLRSRLPTVRPISH